jgi:sugar lactone lactonase YvrE
VIGNIVVGEAAKNLNILEVYMRRWLSLFLTIILYGYISNAWASGVTSIKGTLLMLNNKTPQVYIPVQALHHGKVTATTLSDGNGRYQFTHLSPGSYQLRCQVLDGYIYYRATSDGLPIIRYESQAAKAATLAVESGKTLDNIDFRFPAFKKGTWKHYDTLNGLAYNVVSDIHCDPDGIMWFATEGGGVSRYDGNSFSTFTTKDGLAHNDVFTVYCATDGVIWFGTGGGVSCYDGKNFRNFTVEDGLVGNIVRDIYRDSDGTMWFATKGGVSRYDGKSFLNFTTKDGLAHNNVFAVYCATDGVLWFGTEGGVSRYDGRSFQISPPKTD